MCVVSHGLHFLHYNTVFTHTSSRISFLVQIVVVHAIYVGFVMALRRIGEVEDDDDEEVDGETLVGK